MPAEDLFQNNAFFADGGRAASKQWDELWARLNPHARASAEAFEAVNDAVNGFIAGRWGRQGGVRGGAGAVPLLGK
eukprot:gene20865-66800_t